eukprot:77707-Alexandrium_andersonii.AAC.1
MERFLSRLVLPRLLAREAFGSSQFAYIPGRGARDALLFLVLELLAAFANGRRVALYCSGVSGAFDKVCASLLSKKLTAAGVHPKMVR